MAELMKGHKWRDHKHKMTYPAWVELKLDEIRCRVVVLPQGPKPAVTFLSYAEKPLHNLERFADGFRELCAHTGVHEFDCGFEANGNFNDSYRWVRSSKGLPPELGDKPVKFFLFDVPESNKDFSGRCLGRSGVVLSALAIDFPLYEPAGTWAHSAEDVERLFAEARKKGVEGLMVKSTDHLYQRGKRTYGWLKVKPEDDADGVIVSIHQAIAEDGTPHDRAGSVTVRCEDGSTATPHGIDHELGKDMLKSPHKYIGQWAEFKFMERDRQGGYRHPVWNRLREAKA